MEPWFEAKNHISTSPPVAVPGVSKHPRKALGHLRFWTLDTRQSPRHYHYIAIAEHGYVLIREPATSSYHCSKFSYCRQATTMPVPGLLTALALLLGTELWGKVCLSSCFFHHGNANHQKDLSNGIYRHAKEMACSHPNRSHGNAFLNFTKAIAIYMPAAHSIPKNNDY